jgi:uncharacterized damage-inducible protein DinB
MTAAFRPLEISEYWAPINQHLIGLLDLIPDDKMDWSPKPELHNFRGLFIHIASARNSWMARDVQDGEDTPDVLREGQTREGLKEQLRLSWARMERFLSSREKLDATYDVPDGGHAGGTRPRDGHWLAFHGLEHDVHHRADIFYFMALLGIEHGDIETP